jgi:acyl dehydratase
VFANLAWEKISLPKPVFEGDTIRSRSTVLGVRESNSRPTMGMVTVHTEGYNQRGEVVCSFERTAMVYKQGHGPNAERIAKLKDEYAQKDAEAAGTQS